jgi:DUF4097 and DUF4098 domain-containing protein YvlB
MEGRLSGFVRSLLGNLPWSDRLEAEEVLHFEKPNEGIVRLHDGNGSMSITGEDRGDIELRVIKIARAECEEGAEELLDGMRIRPAFVGGALELEVEIPEKWNRRGTVNLEMRVPRELSVELSATNGRIEVEGVRGCVRARSRNGSATIRDVVGDISVTTSNAKVSCLDTCGRLVARSRDGKIELQQHRGSIDASTSNGLIRASVEEVGESGVSLATSNGRIVLDLPEEVDADVDVRVDNGTIRNDLEQCHCTRSSQGRVLGRLGAGGALIKLRTSNGSVYLR